MIVKTRDRGDVEIPAKVYRGFAVHASCYHFFSGNPKPHYRVSHEGSGLSLGSDYKNKRAATRAAKELALHYDGTVPERELIMQFRERGSKPSAMEIAKKYGAL